MDFLQPVKWLGMNPLADGEAPTCDVRSRRLMQDGAPPPQCDRSWRLGRVKEGAWSRRQGATQVQRWPPSHGGPRGQTGKLARAHNGPRTLFLTAKFPGESPRRILNAETLFCSLLHPKCRKLMGHRKAPPRRRELTWGQGARCLGL